MKINGDVKLGYQLVDHDGWWKMDGRALNGLSIDIAKASALGINTNLPDANNKYPGQSNNFGVGVTHGSNFHTLTRANLPDETLKITTIPDELQIRHDFYLKRNPPNLGYDATFGNYWAPPGEAPMDTEPNITESLSGNQVQQPFETTPATINLNMFIYIV